ncbi:MAG: tol-pal system protein YbgF [Deltaproteobacteria bacterium CG_4_10_14_0_2_um_filter_43_8]|nr:MAG: tol-pal system protein YbgF [Deltaproteobacteria bacterium CG11_big_fil_rev_8_21_14_0_20_42_23]PJA20970.1 MAG: tol-pal system protein YbgF [Deltaproteobacteria bacterium CG_4_10_14_0_2_um_filter_43_8]PJC63658.1 MAG: tol-pal system protein YbgF [Deltaproteobacteria bacterium CG_4_9_14_0_2_um_filter_42_21]
MKNFFSLSLLALLLFSSFSAHSKSDTAKIDELEKRLHDIELTYLQNNAGLASAIAKVNASDVELQKINGEIDANRHLLQTQQLTLQKLFLDITHRMQILEERMHVVSKQVTKAISSISPKTAQEGKLYQQALSKVEEGSYLEAVAEFQRFLTKFPKSSFASGARYWIAESYFSLRDWQKAIKEFQSFLTKHPKNEKGNEALLKQGISFKELSLNEDAKIFFNKLIQSAPNSAEALRAKEIITEMDQVRNAPAPSAPEASSYPSQTLEQQRQADEAPQTPEENKH